MHDALAIVTVTLGFVSVVLAAPQIARLYRTKDSTSFSLATWLTWFIYELAATAYSVEIRSWPFTAITVCWLALYVIIISLIIRYRKPALTKKALTREQSKV